MRYAVNQARSGLLGYAPIELVRALIVGAAENSGIRNPKPLLTDLVAVAMLAAWRMTQGIYVFDPDVQHDIWTTQVSGDIPSDVLFHLPEWCCLVSAPMRVFDDEALGFLVSLNSDSENLPPELWLLVVYKREDVDVEPLCLTLVGSITEAIQGGLAKLKRTTLSTSPQQKEAALVRLNERYDRHIQDLEGMVSLALYLASENREISNPLGQQPQNPGPTSTKRAPRTSPPPSPTKWDVGLRFCAALRAAREHQEPNAGHFSSGSRGLDNRPVRVKWLM